MDTHGIPPMRRESIRSWASKATYREVELMQKDIDEKLRADDPRFRRSVVLIHGDGSFAFYRDAFLERADFWILLFTEHHGCKVYHSEDLQFFAQYRGGKNPFVTEQALETFAGVAARRVTKDKGRAAKQAAKPVVIKTIRRPRQASA